MLKHKKVSGVPNTSSSLVGGADWDDAHIYQVGSLFPLAFVEFVPDYVAEVLAATVHQSTARLVSVAINEIGASHYDVVLDVSALPVPTGATVAVRMVYSVLDPNAGGAVRLAVTAFDPQTGAVTIYGKDAADGNAAVPTSGHIVQMQFWLEVLA